MYHTTLPNVVKHTPMFKITVFQRYNINKCHPVNNIINAIQISRKPSPGLNWNILLFF